MNVKYIFLVLYFAMNYSAIQSPPPDSKFKVKVDDIVDLQAVEKSYMSFIEQSGLPMGTLLTVDDLTKLVEKDKLWMINQYYQEQKSTPDDPNKIDAFKLLDILKYMCEILNKCQETKRYRTNIGTLS